MVLACSVYRNKTQLHNIKNSHEHIHAHAFVQGKNTYSPTYACSAAGFVG